GVGLPHAVGLQIAGGHELHLGRLVDLHFEDLLAFHIKGAEQESHVSGAFGVKIRERDTGTPKYGVRRGSHPARALAPTPAQSFTLSTGKLVWLTMSSVRLPFTTWKKPVRPCVAMAIRSASVPLAK